MAQRKAPAGGERYAAVIREARQAAGMNQQALADRLGMSRNTVAGWETGHSRPDLDLIPSLCDVLGISLSCFFGTAEKAGGTEKRLLACFRTLEPGDRAAMIWQMEALAAGRKAQRARAERREALQIETLRDRVVSIYRSDLSAAAGTGTTLEAERGTRMWLKRDPLTERADEVITVNGHSMEPTFMEGDEVLVEHTDALREGEIGIFLADGEGFIKEYRKDGLHSHNPEYAVMRFSEGNDVRCIGRVLGRVEESQRLNEQETLWLEESR